MKHKALTLGLALVCVLAMVGWGGGLWTNAWDGVKVGKGDTGTKYNFIGAYEFTFVDSTAAGATATTGLPTGATYRVFTGWKTNSANGEAKVTVTAGTMTAVSGTATTGTLDVLLMGIPS